MKKIIFIFSILLISLASHSQGGWLKNNNSHGTIGNGYSADSAIAFPTGCGAPTTMSGINKYSKPIKKANQYLDTCAHKFWFYDPKLDAWDTLRVGSLASLGSGYPVYTTGIKSLFPYNGNSGDTLTPGQIGISLGSPTALSKYTPITLNGFPLTINHDGVNNAAQSDSNSLRLTNNTIAVSSTDSNVTPGIVQSVSGWKTSSGGASRNVRFRTDAFGKLGNPNGGATYRIASSINGAAYTNLVTIDAITGNMSGPVSTAGSPLIVNTARLGAGGGTFFGINAYQANTSGSANIAFGGSALIINTSGSNNTVVGESAMTVNIIGNYNTAIGYHTLSLNDSDLNTAVGYTSMLANTKGDQNAAFGATSLTANTTGRKNVAIGPGAMEANTTGGFNTGVGHDVLLHNITGTNNVAAGWLSGALATAGNGNVSLGFNAGSTMTGGDNNIFIGNSSGTNGSQTATPTNSIAIGASSFTTASNQMVLGNSSLTQAILYGTTHNNTAALTVLMQDTVTKNVYHMPVSALGSSVSGRSVAQTAAVATLATQTVGASDASFKISANVLVTTSSAESFTVRVVYTDEANTSRTLTLLFNLPAGTTIAGVQSAQGAIPYAGLVSRIRAKASTTITISTSGTFTGCTYNVEGTIETIQ